MSTDPVELLRLLRQEAERALADTPVDATAQRDQAAALWRNFLSEQGISLRSPDQVLGIVAGLRLGSHCVDLVNPAPEEAEQLHRLLLGAQHLVLSMTPDLDLPTLDTPEGGEEP